MKVAAIIQARMSSTRLPNKVLADIEGKPMLWHVINRLKRAELVDEIIVATTTNRKDESIIELAKETKAEWFRGSESDVLDRYYQAAKKHGSDIIVRITPDCPLIDPEVIDKVIERFFIGNLDYVSNVHPPTYPDGLDIEVFSFKTLKKAWEEAKKSSEREHVTLYVVNHPEIFIIGNIENEKNLSYMRWCIDEQKDLKFIKEIYKRLYKNDEIFNMNDILSLLKKEPELMKINEGILRNEGLIKSLKEDKK
ncbi:glycosyltransferase family protein [bacterium]|nr:glycosyltransferase family protein [bacterium]